MDGGAGFPYWAENHFNAARYAVLAHGATPTALVTHRGLCLSSARIWSLGFSPNLSAENKRVQSVWGSMVAVWRHPWKLKELFGSYLSRKSLSTTAEMSSRGFPIPKSVFSLDRDRSRLCYSDFFSLSRHNYHSLVSDLMDPVSSSSSSSSDLPYIVFGSWQCARVGHMLPEGAPTCKVTSFHFETQQCSTKSKWAGIPSEESQ